MSTEVSAPGELKLSHGKLSQPRRLVTPSREQLLTRFQELESNAVKMLGIELVLFIAGSVLWFIRPGLEASWVTIALFFMGFFGMFDFVLSHFFANRKPLEKVNPEARLSVHSRESIRAAVQRVQERLGLNHEPVKVFLANEKDVNAYAMRCDLLPGLRLFNGVQLNRAILHLLSEEELESVIGHELGHVFPYAPITSRCMLLHALLSGVLGLWFASFLDNFGFTIIGPIVAIWAVQWWTFGRWTSHVRMVEFLCDDLGALAAGLLPAMTAEVKLGLEQQARTHLMEQVLQAKLNHTHLSVEELMRLYEDSLPFGKVEQEQTRAQIQARLRQFAQTDEQNSLIGFFKYLYKGNDSDLDAIEEVVKRIRFLRQLECVPVSPAVVLQNPQLMGGLLAAIEDNSDQVLFQVEQEIDDTAQTHPNTSRRLLYLWRNRDDIEKARALLTRSMHQVHV